MILNSEYYGAREFILFREMGLCVRVAHITSLSDTFVYAVCAAAQPMANTIRGQTGELFATLNGTDCEVRLQGDLRKLSVARLIKNYLFNHILFNATVSVGHACNCKFGTLPLSKSHPYSIYLGTWFNFLGQKRKKELTKCVRRRGGVSRAA